MRVTDVLCRTVLQLPTGLQLTPDDATTIAAIVARTVTAEAAA